LQRFWFQQRLRDLFATWQLNITRLICGFHDRACDVWPMPLECSTQDLRTFSVWVHLAGWQLARFKKQLLAAQTHTLLALPGPVTRSRWSCSWTKLHFLN
jgi:hypothetical protein